MIASALAATMAFSRTEARSIRQSCQVPAAWITLRRDGAVHLAPPKNANVEKVDCILSGMKKFAEKRGQWPSAGFVGNEMPAPEPEKPE